MHMCVLSCFSQVQLFAILWTVAHQAPLSMGFPRQEYWSGLPCPPPGDLPDPGIKRTSLMSSALAGVFFTISTTWEVLRVLNLLKLGILKLMSSDSVMPSQPSQPLSSPSLPTFNLSQHQDLFQWLNCSHEVAKVLEFQLQHQSFQWTPRTDLL